MEIKQLDNITIFNIKETTNLTEKKEIKIFHELLCKSITYSNSINDIQDNLMLLLENSSIPYTLVNFDKLEYLIKTYIY